MSKAEEVKARKYFWPRYKHKMYVIAEGMNLLIQFYNLALVLLYEGGINIYLEFLFVNIDT